MTQIEPTEVPSDAPQFRQVRPLDEYNRRLLANVHPPDWANPTPSGRYNLVVIGGGTAGLVTAAGAAGLGAKVALVERTLLGGDCLNVGCVPSKALLRCARAVYDAREAHRYGVRLSAGDCEVDFPAVMERMRRLRAEISPHDSAARFRDLGIDVFLGEARFTGPDALDVEGQSLRFSRACIATGSRPVAPPIAGLKEAGYLTNETVFSLTDLPSRLAVLGGGPIGCELAQAFARFGSQVFLVEMAEQVLIREDRDAAEIIARRLQRDGVELLLSTKLAEVKPSGASRTLVVESANGERRELDVDELIVAVGRQPNVQNLGLDAAGVAFDEQQGVRVNDFLRTTNRRIYAAGDVCFPYKFTHTADAQARIVIQNALFFGWARSSALTVPWCTYTDPELAHVGLPAAEARKRGIAVETFTTELARVDRAVLDGEEEGFLKVHIRKGRHNILGATLVARHAGEMISEITLAMVSGAGLKGIGKTIHPYPTQAEIVKKTADAWNHTRLTPPIKWLLERLLAWRR